MDARVARLPHELAGLVGRVAVVGVDEQLGVLADGVADGMDDLDVATEPGVGLHPLVASAYLGLEAAEAGLEAQRHGVEHGAEPQVAARLGVEVVEVDRAVVDGHGLDARVAQHRVDRLPEDPPREVPQGEVEGQEGVAGSRLRVEGFIKRPADEPARLVLVGPRRAPANDAGAGVEPHDAVAGVAAVDVEPGVPSHEARPRAFERGGLDARDRDIPGDHRASHWSRKQ